MEKSPPIEHERHALDQSGIPASALPAERPTAVIEPGHGFELQELRSLWQYRELLFFLTLRDIQVRYKQTLLGAAWAVLQPLLTMIIFTFVFSIFAKVPSGGVPYPLFAYTALLPWQYFSGAFSRAGESLVNNANLVSKVYFPRLIVPLAAAIAPVVDFVFALLLLFAMMLFYHTPLHWAVLLFPLLLLVSFLTAFAASLWLSALNVKYRDVKYVIPFMIQAWMYLSPIPYPLEIIPQRYQFIYTLNPMVTVVQAFRWMILGTPFALDPVAVAISMVLVLLILVSGVIFFQRTGETFADVI